MKKISVAIFTPVIVGVAASLVSYFPSYFHLPPEWAKFVSSIPTVGAMATGGIIFLATLSRKDEQRLGIITRINDKVFKSWLNTTAELRHQVDTFLDSFMPLYVDIISKIKSPGRYRQAKSEENMLVNQILNDIEISQDDHNTRVANLIKTLNSDMMNTMQRESQGLLHQFDRITASNVPWYNIGLLHDHLRNDVQNTHEELRVIPSPDEMMTVLRRVVSNLPAGTEDDMVVLMQIVTSFQAEAVPRGALSTYRRRPFSREMQFRIWISEKIIALIPFPHVCLCL